MNDQLRSTLKVLGVIAGIIAGGVALFLMNKIVEPIVSAGVLQILDWLGRSYHLGRAYVIGYLAAPLAPWLIAAWIEDGIVRERYERSRPWLYAKLIASTLRALASSALTLEIIALLIAALVFGKLDPAHAYHGISQIGSDIAPERPIGIGLTIGLPVAIGTLIVGVPFEVQDGRLQVKYSINPDVTDEEPTGSTASIWMGLLVAVGTVSGVLASVTWPMTNLQIGATALAATIMGTATAIQMKLSARRD